MADLLLFADQWLDPAGNNDDSNANLDGLGGIDLSDFALIAQNWSISSGCPITAEDKVKDTKFSHNRGFYEAPFDVTISTGTSGATIKYTLDGSDPRVSPTAFARSNPCTVTINPASTNNRRATPAVTLRAWAFMAGLQPTNVDTQTYVFPTAVVGQPEIVPSGSHIFWTTSMDPKVTQNPAYANMMTDAILSIPTMSVVMNWEDLFGLSGIHRGNNLEKVDYEKLCSIELFYPDKPQFAGFSGFQEDCGIRIQGGGGRWDQGTYDHKQSFGLRFRREYGNGTLKYPVFESAPMNAESEAGEYDKLVLRAGHNKSYGAIWDPLHTVFTRDQLGRDLQLAMSGIGSRGTFVHLYLNGIYWGLYNICERPDHAFSASYLKGTEEDYYSGKAKGGTVSGDSTRFNLWRNTVSTSADYNYLQQFLDVDAYLDMALIGVFANIGDYPQFYYGNSNKPAGRIYFYQWDIEDSFGGGSRRTGAPDRARLAACYSFTNMWTYNAEFRMKLADRAYRACCNDGAFTTAEITERWLQLCNNIDLAIVGESARWGDERSGDTGRGWDGTTKYHDPAIPVYTRNGHWIPARDAVTTDLQNRAALTISTLRGGSYAGYPYYPSFDPPLFKHAGTTIKVSRKQVPAGYNVTIERVGSSGNVCYTVNGPDPRAPGGTVQGINAGSGATVTINSTTNLKARTLNGVTWSALHEAVFFVDQEFGDLKITEIMYNPLTTLAATSLSIVRIIGNDTASGNYDRARVEFAVDLPAVLTLEDKLIIRGAKIPENNGTFTVHHVEGRNVILKTLLTNETNTPAVADFVYNGNRYEFAEFKNTGTTALNLSGITFTRGIRYSFPDGTLLAPGAFVVIASRAVDFAARYPGKEICGEYFGLLDNAGDTLELGLGTGETFIASQIVGNDDGRGRLVFAQLPAGLKAKDRIQLARANNASNNGMYTIESIAGNQVYVTKALTSENAGAKVSFFKVIMSVQYDDETPWPLGPDGLGYSLVAAETNPAGDPGSAAYWRTSTSTYGSPGYDDPAPPLIPAILINEVLAHTDWPQVDTIELYNPTPAAVELGGWWLTDEKKNATKYRILPGSVIGAADHWVIEADNHPINAPPADYFGGAFRLSSYGEEIYLFSPDLRYSHGLAFGVTESGVSLGRYVTSQGDEHFVAQVANSFGWANSDPRIGPVVISEIMYNPPAGHHEFLELVNISSAPAALYNLNNRWQVSGVGFTFPANIELQPNEILLLVGSTISPADFRMQYGIAPNVRIFNFMGKLDNGGETVRLSKPDVPDADYVPYIVVDEVTYDDQAPWPIEPDGNGPSLERIDLRAYANDPVNWQKSGNAGGTPGLVAQATEPMIALSPSTLFVSTLQGHNPEHKIIEIWNAGADTLSYSVSASVDWMDVSAAAGTSDGSQDRRQHTVAFFTSALNPGIYTGVITVASAGADNGPLTMSVTVNVRTPEISLSRQNLEASASTGRNAPDQTFEVWNKGIGILYYSVADDVSWLSVTPEYGTVAGYEDRIAHTVAFSTDSLDVGTHAATITVTDAHASNNPQTIHVTLEILTPQIALSTTSLTPVAGQGGIPAEDTLEVWNSGPGMLNYAVVGDADWLHVTPSSGSSTGPQDKVLHTIGYAVGTLPAGRHDATITVSDPAASNSPRTISVILLVFEQPPFVAYNDLNSIDSTNAPNVTGYDYAAINEPLRDIDTGEYLAVTATGGYSPPEAYDPVGNGGNFTNAASDAYQTFNGIVDLTGIPELDAADWANVITFKNLAPDWTYTITLTANRNASNYNNQRFTRVTIEGAETYTNASSTGVVVNSEASVSFSTGYNTVNGYVAKWTNISPGTDGSFSIRSEWDAGRPGNKGYAMSAFKFESHAR
ncbi:MAG: lamin tail domain-containing protein [Phycisphaerae bacterium]|nr:lamin tail domain-containing protein [Phycisphaerae bacterium]